MTQPNILTVPFAESAAPQTIQEIPISRDPADPIQKATWSTGFPAATMQPLATGGVPPMGQDFNGILKALSEHIVYQNKGGVYRWSADVVSSGGYDKGAVVQAADGIRSYVSLIDGNTEPLDGNNWLLISMPIATVAQAQVLTADDVALTPKKLADAFKGANSALGSGGFQILPSGLILQWGIATVTGTQPVDRALPISFTSSTNIGQIVCTFDNPEAPAAGYPLVAGRIVNASTVRIGAVSENQPGGTFLIRYFVTGR